MSSIVLSIKIPETIAGVTFPNRHNPLYSQGGCQVNILLFKKGYQNPVHTTDSDLNETTNFTGTQSFIYHITLF